MKKEDQLRAQSFNSFAELYDEVRPTYPIPLIEDIISISKIPARGHILEIGSGTGKATLPFVERGYSVVCLEPGENLANVLKQKCAPFKNVAVECVTFQDWKLKEDAFDLVIAAQSFHWVPPEVGYLKAAKALHEGGFLALFWNMHPDPTTEVFQALDAAYAKYAPEVLRSEHNKEPYLELDAKRRAEFNARYFKNIIVKRYPWSLRYSLDDYLKLLNTYSDHALLPPEKQRALYAGIREALKKFGDSIDKPYVAHLYIGEVNKRPISS